MYVYFKNNESLKGYKQAVKMPTSKKCNRKNENNN